MSPKVHVKSFGCSANHSEGEMMKGILKKAEYALSEESDSDVLVLNVCTVKGNRTALQEIRKAKRKYPGKKILLAGCVTRDLLDDARHVEPTISTITTYAVPAIVPAVHQTLHQIHVSNFSRNFADKINVPRVRTNPVIAIVPICSGCLDACAFCSTVLVKGRLRSYAPEAIMRDVRTAIDEGCKEVWLTGQDAACYGFDRGTDVVHLLEHIVKIPGDFKVRLGMGNPRHILRYIDRLCRIMSHEKIFKFLHIPLQSGSNDVLRSMKRQHTVEEWICLVEKLRAAVPQMTISTDVICGFPGETEEQFQETLNVLEQERPCVINISRFAPRPGTSAARMTQTLSTNDLKARSRRLTKLFFSVAEEENKKWIGWTGPVLIDEKGHISGSWISRNDAYKPIAVKGDFALGQQLNVSITGASKYACIGRAL